MSLQSASCILHTGMSILRSTEMTYVQAFFDVRQALIVAVVFLTATSAPGQDRLPAPAESAQADALALIKEVYGEEWKDAKTSAQKQALGTKLLKKASESTDDANRYALLKVARDIAAQAGDAELAFRAIDAMASRYAVDAYRLKGATLSRASKSTSSSAQSAAVAKFSLDLVDEAVGKDDFVAAKYLGNLALDAARKGRDGQLVKRAVARNKEVEGIAEAYAQVGDAFVTLMRIPDDPEANLAVGEYHCFVRGDWDRGLPKLALGSDEPLKKLAMKELEEVSGADEQMELGDGWWNLASAREGVAKQQVQGRAAHWYRKALPGLTGLVKDRVEKRLEEVLEFGGITSPGAIATHIKFEPGKPLKAGIIGTTTSYVKAFTKLLNAPNATGDLADVEVVAGFTGGVKDNPDSWNRRLEYTEYLRQQGCTIYDTIGELLKHVDVVLLLSVDGRPHLAQARPVIAAGKPLYIGKPMAASLADVMEIFRLADENNVPVFSSSALRFAEGYHAARYQRTSPFGKVRSCVAWAPMKIEPHHPDLFWYGIHGCEILYTIMGPGCKTVARVEKEKVVGVWEDGRRGTFIGKNGYGAEIVGTKSSGQLVKSDGTEPLVIEMCRFFKTGKPPVTAEETIELFAFMEAADESKRRGGRPVTIRSVISKAQKMNAARK